MKSKIGLVSYHRDPNYGTMLQAFALASSIKKYGLDCEYLNYYEYKKPTIFKKVLSRFYHKIKKYFNIKSGGDFEFFNNEEFKQVMEAFYDFHEKYIPYSKKKYYADTVTDAIKDYDFFIVGSDQTWSEAVNKIGTTINFLEFERDQRRKRSYAPSIGTIHIGADYLDNLSIKLNDFEFLSCRERPNCELLGSILSKRVEYVLDPTLLLTSSDWNDYIKSPIIKGKYILAYILGTRECISSYATMLGKYYDIPVYYILTRPEYLLKENLLSDVGPLDFVNLIKNASYVITDSFHGTIFSLNFGKNFYAFTKREGSETILDNDRIRVFLQEFNLTNRLITKEFPTAPEPINYVEINDKLNLLRDTSINYLKQIILN